MSTLLHVALTATGQAPREFRILPAGEFRAVDGRPAVGNWLLTKERAALMMSEAAKRSQDYLIDYEHQSLKAGEVARAAGWFKRLVWKDDGLYAADVRWTATAAAMIKAGEYRFISPVFRFASDTGEVLSLLSVGMTNNPALRGLTDLTGVAVNSASFLVATPETAAMSVEERANYIHCFGNTPESLLEQHRLSQERSPAPEGMSEEDWHKFQHVFGGLPS